LWWGECWIPAIIINPCEGIPDSLLDVASDSTQNNLPVWSSRLAFIFAAVGGAVGFANFWRFPFLVGENGGGIFVLVYIFWVAVLGIPIIIAELVLGRRGHGSPLASMRKLVREENSSHAWKLIGWFSIIIPFLALTFYSVIASWSLEYFSAAALNHFANYDAAKSTGAFERLLASPVRMFLWHSLFMAVTVTIVAFGVQRGLETAVKIMIPALLVILIALVIFAAFKGDFIAGFQFMFYPDISKLTLGIVFLALGQAFFSLSVGGGYLMTYSAYLPDTVSLPWASVSIGVIDLLIALLAGLAIFPIVFAFGLEVSSGPGLMFVTLPVAFGNMPGGVIVGSLFFLLLAFAAFTSTISMLEPAVAWIQENPKFSRVKASLGLGIVAWILGVVFILSFNVWKDIKPLAGVPFFEDRNLFGIVDLLVANLMLPLNALLIALFCGWVISESVAKKELALRSEKLFSAWLWIVRVLAPVAISLVLITSMK
jgi:neurotransmitter:Na+ symporter, NSS family